MSSKISTPIAQTAKLLNESINNSGKEISTQNRALASSFIATHFSVDGIAEKLGFDADTIKKYQEGDKHFLLSEALMENPKILQDPEKMNLLTDHLSSLSVDISLHGYQQGTSEFSIADKGGLLKNLADRMSDGGEILYNSCLTGRGTEEGANNLALNTLMTAAKDKGLKVHAADNETIGYQEDTVYDAFSRLIANTPRKLDGIVGGYTIQEGGKEEISNREDTSKKQIAEYIRSKKEQGS